MPPKVGSADLYPIYLRRLTGTSISLYSNWFSHPHCMGIIGGTFQVVGCAFRLRDHCVVDVRRWLLLYVLQLSKKAQFLSFIVFRANILLCDRLTARNVRSLNPVTVRNAFQHLKKWTTTISTHCSSLR